MVSTRACKLDKSKNGVNNSGIEKTKMKTCSNPESEDEDQTAHGSAPSGSAASSIKVTLKKTRSCSSSSSRGSAQSFEVVRSVLPASESVSEGEDGQNQKDSDNDNISNKCSDANNSGNEKESDSEEDSQNANSSGDDEIEVLSSGEDSQDSSEKPIAEDVSVKDENNVSLHTEVDLKTEEVIPSNPTTVKNETATVSLKEELIKESYAESGDLDVLKHDVDNTSSEVSQPLNGIEKKETREEVKEQKFKLNVRSFNDLAGPRPVNLINMPPPGQMDGPPNYLSQNGAPFPPPFISIPCDVCGLQFDSSELLNDHKVAMKHFKCSFKECELLMISSQHEFQEHQRIIHNIMPSPVQQLAHQVQRLPAMGFDQQLQSGVSSLPDALAPQSGVPNMYTQPLRMPNQPVPMQRSMRPSMMRPSMPHNMMSGRPGRTLMRPSRGRPAIMGSNMGRGGGTMKRPASMPVRHAPPPKRAIPLDRNSYSNSPTKSTQMVKSFSETLSKSLTASANKTSTNQDVVNLFSKRGLTISTVDSGNNISLPAGLSLNSAVTIIPTSPHKVPNNVSKKVSNVSNKVPTENLDTVDLTGPDKPREKKFYPCEICSKTYSSVETLYEHISTAHKSYALPFRCNLCPGTFPSFDILNRHKLSFHKSEANPAVPYVIPILDFNKVGTVSKLQSMGVTSYIPVAQLDNQGGQFGVPIMSVSRPGSVDGLKYTNFFNLGCIRKL